MSNVWRVAVDIRGSALPSAAKAFTLEFEVKGGHYQSGGFVCVSVIRERVRIISQMRSIGF